MLLLVLLYFSLDSRLEHKIIDFILPFGNHPEV
jgi:hypothetical protein